MIQKMLMMIINDGNYDYNDSYHDDNDYSYDDDR